MRTRERLVAASACALACLDTGPGPVRGRGGSRNSVTSAARPTERKARQTAKEPRGEASPRAAQEQGRPAAGRLAARAAATFQETSIGASARARRWNGWRAGRAWSGGAKPQGLSFVLLERPLAAGSWHWRAFFFSRWGLWMCAGWASGRMREAARVALQGSPARPAIVLMWHSEKPRV